MDQYDWTDYYVRAFPYFDSGHIRPGCKPLMLLQPGRSTDRAIVLMHGLSDSPYYMRAIAWHFFDVLKYDVYLPLLHFHGMDNVVSMEGVSHLEWKRNVNFAINQAKTRSSDISIGGLSTGGALSFREAAIADSRITGDLYLFSAAMTLASVLSQKIIGGRVLSVEGGDAEEEFLRASFMESVVAGMRLFGIGQPLIGAQPYKYEYVDLYAARQLALLIAENDRLTTTFSHRVPFPRRVFAAHSEADETAHIDGIEQLQTRCRPDRFHFYRIPKVANVSHPGLVLSESIQKNIAGEMRLMQAHNPQFETMMKAVTRFATMRDTFDPARAIEPDISA